MAKILHQLRLVVYPTIYRVLYNPGGAGFCPSILSLEFLDPKVLSITNRNPIVTKWEFQRLYFRIPRKNNWAMMGCDGINASYKAARLYHGPLTFSLILECPWKLVNYQRYVQVLLIFHLPTFGQDLKAMAFRHEMGWPESSLETIEIGGYVFF